MVKVELGREKWRDCGLWAWRRRQIWVISSGGRVRTLGRSRKEVRVLTPGGGVPDVVDESLDGEGGGGGGWKGDLDVDVDEGDGVGFRGAVAPGTAAFLRSPSILSL